MSDILHATRYILDVIEEERLLSIPMSSARTEVAFHAIGADDCVRIVNLLRTLEWEARTAPSAAWLSGVSESGWVSITLFLEGRSFKDGAAEEVLERALAGQPDRSELDPGVSDA